MVAAQATTSKVHGVLPVTAAQVAGDTTKSGKTRAPQEGDKVVVRRLPPGLTEAEFFKVVGEDWKSKQGKVRWFDYKDGKISRDPAKPSRPARAYLQVLRKEHLELLSNTVRSAKWEDAKGSWKSMTLPPAVEFSLYKKVPGGRRRTDARQGTIDQDPDLMDFLDQIVNPRKSVEACGADDGLLSGKATSTPLIEYLREKKAKAKDAKEARAAAKHTRHDSKGKGVVTLDDGKKRGRDTKGEKASDKSKEALRLLNKKAADAAEAAKFAASQIAAAKEDAPKTRRAGIAAIARTLQRDLGLSPGNAHRKARQQASNLTKTEPESNKTREGATTAALASSSPSRAPSTADVQTSVHAGSKPQGQQPNQARGARDKKVGDAAKTKAATEKVPAAPAPPAPKILLKKRDESSSNAASGAAQIPLAIPLIPAPSLASKGSQVKGGPTPSRVSRNSSSGAGAAGSARAFLKHANPSQGVTEALLKEAMLPFGGVNFVEIDRRKGFAYVDFVDQAALTKAIAASPVSVAQATVQVLERRDAKKNGSSTGPAPTTSAIVSTSNGKAPTPAAQAPEKPISAPTETRRGGRRRGGRGRGADGHGKDTVIASGNSKAAEPAKIARPAVTNNGAG